MSLHAAALRVCALVKPVFFYFCTPSRSIFLVKLRFCLISFHLLTNVLQWLQQHIRCPYLGAGIFPPGETKWSFTTNSIQNVNKNCPLEAEVHRHWLGSDVGLLVPIRKIIWTQQTVFFLTPQNDKEIFTGINILAGVPPLARMSPTRANAKFGSKIFVCISCSNERSFSLEPLVHALSSLPNGSADLNRLVKYNLSPVQVLFRRYASNLNTKTLCGHLTVQVFFRITVCFPNNRDRYKKNGKAQCGSIR